MSTPASTKPSAAAIAAERIRALNSLNEQVPQLLNAAGLAISSLTNRPLQTNPHNENDMAASPNPSASPEDLRAQFQVHTRNYAHLLSSISSSLRTEAAHMVDSGIIPMQAPAPPTLGVRGGTAEERARVLAAEVKNSGLGDFDVGWLNERTVDVGEGMLAEIVAETKELLASVEADSKDGDLMSGILRTTEKN